MEINPQRGDLCTITELFFEPVMEVTTTTTHYITAQKQAHFIPNGTRLAQEYLDRCVLRGANMFAQQEMGHVPRTLALMASQGRVYRDGQLDERSMSSSLNKERKRRQDVEGKRQKKQKHTTRDGKRRGHMERKRNIIRETNMRSERETGARERLPETLPCVHSKRSRVYSRRPCHTRHGSVFQCKKERDAHTATATATATTRTAQPNHTLHTHHTLHWEERHERAKKRDEDEKRETNRDRDWDRWREIAMRRDRDEKRESERDTETNAVCRNFSRTWCFFISQIHVRISLVIFLHWAGNAANLPCARLHLKDYVLVEQWFFSFGRRIMMFSVFYLGELRTALGRKINAWSIPTAPILM